MSKNKSPSKNPKPRKEPKPCDRRMCGNLADPHALEDWHCPDHQGGDHC